MQNKKCFNKKKSHGEFYGATKIGERGQVVIPAKAREYFQLEKGVQMLVFGMQNNIIALIKVEKLKEFTEHLTDKLKAIEKVLKDLG